MGTDGASSHHDIAENPALLAETKTVLPALADLATRPAGQAGVKRVYGSRFATFAQPERSDGEWAAWWKDRFDVLAEIPESALDNGMQVWLRGTFSRSGILANADTRFLPLPFELRELAIKEKNQAATAYARAKMAVGQAELNAEMASRPQHKAATTEWPPERTPADRAAVAKMLKEFTVKMAENAERRPKAPETPPVHGKIDGGGITPELRAIMARRAG